MIDQRWFNMTISRYIPDFDIDIGRSFHLFINKIHQQINKQTFKQTNNQQKGKSVNTTTNNEKKTYTNARQERGAY